MPETFFTVWANVFDRSALQPGETLLVHGGASGIGTTAVLLGKAFGATVLVTVGSAAKAEFCRTLGADHAINHRVEGFVVAVKAATDGVWPLFRAGALKPVSDSVFPLARADDAHRAIEAGSQGQDCACSRRTCLNRC